MISPEQPASERLVAAVAIEVLLQDVHFPIKKQTLIQQYGNAYIEWIPGTVESLEQLLQNTTQEAFYSVTDVVAALSQPGH